MRATFRVRSRSTAAAGGDGAATRPSGRAATGEGGLPPSPDSAGARAPRGIEGVRTTPRQPLPGTREAWPQRVGWLMTANGS